MNLIFKHLTTNFNTFFEILPQDWQDEISPFWSSYKDSAKIYVIIENQQIIGGGIIFATCPPDLKYFELEAKNWFNNGFLYLGFIWIAEDKRNNNLGSYWLDQLKIKHPKQKYWLLVEEEQLHRFYQRNGFVLEKAIKHNSKQEWLFSFIPNP